VRHLLTPAPIEAEALASVRTLVLIGSEAAQSALSAYADDARPSVRGAAQRALSANEAQH